MSLCLTCWTDLDSCRSIGPMGAGAIPYTAILMWAQFQRVDRELTHVLIDVIRILDVARLERLTSKESLR